MKIKINIAEGCGCGTCDACSAPEENEARMHRTTLAHLMADVKVLMELIQDGDDLPEWLETKITKAGDYMSSAARYIAGNVAREQGQLEEQNFSDGLVYHLENDIPVNENIFRPGSDEYFKLFKEVRTLNQKGMYELTEAEGFFINETPDLGEWGWCEEEQQMVPLDFPLYEKYWWRKEIQGLCSFQVWSSKKDYIRRQQRWFKRQLEQP
jgi:hypothetical protein